MPAGHRPGSPAGRHTTLSPQYLSQVAVHNEYGTVAQCPVSLRASTEGSRNLIAGGRLRMARRVDVRYEGAVEQAKASGSRRGDRADVVDVRQRARVGGNADVHIRNERQALPNDERLRIPAARLANSG